MDEKKYKQQNNNKDYCWILDDKIRDVLQLFIIKLEFNDIKNMRLVCRKFQSLIDNNCDRLFNLTFRLTTSENMEKQELEEIIKKNPIITSFFFMNTFNENDHNGDLIQCIPNYTKELKLSYYRDKQLKYEFPSSLESLIIKDSNLSLKCWNSIPSSLSYLILHNTRFFDENENYIFIEEFPLNLKKLSIIDINLTELKIWPQNLIDLKLSNLIISSDQILNLSKLSTLSYLKLEYIINITEIDLSNFNSLKSLTYFSENIFRRQHIYFPSLLETLILDNCTIKNVKSTKLPNSLIHVEFCSNLDTDFISFLLKEENRLPLLRTYSFPFEREEYLLNEYHKLKLYYQTVVTENSIKRKN